MQWQDIKGMTVRRRLAWWPVWLVEERADQTWYRRAHRLPRLGLITERQTAWGKWLAWTSDN